MGFFDWFKKKQEEPVRLIRFARLDEYVEKTLTGKHAHLLHGIEESKDRIQEIVNQLEGLIHHLNKETLRNQRIPLKHISIMEGNRINYVKHYTAFIEKLTISEDSFAIPDDCSRFSADVQKLVEVTSKNQLVLREFFDGTLQKINRKMVELMQEFKQIETLTTSSPFTLIREIRQLQEDYALKKKREAIIEEEKTQLTTQLAQYEDKEQKLVQQIEEIQTGKEYQLHLSLKEELQHVAAEHKKETEELLQLFSTIQKALIKYKRTSDKERIIDDYLTDVLASLAKDDQGEMARILQEVKRQVELNAITLDEKRKEKTIDAIKQLNPTYLRVMREKVREQEQTLMDIQAKLKRDTATLTIEQYKNYLQQNILRAQVIKNQLRDLNDELDKTSVKDIFDQLSMKATALSGYKTKIVLEELSI
ncbi:MAG: hypothetical protein V1725_07350 [archaeon]